jgi:phospholipid/cholesterol/gamma-HCH transport system substrate-binding protein
MPSQQEVKWSQLKVGVIVLIAVFLLGSLLLLMSSASGLDLFSKKITLTTYFPNSEGLKVGAPVNLEGVTVGEVKSVTVSRDPARKTTPVQVIMKLEPKHHAQYLTDSVASLSTVGVLGDTVIDINSEAAHGAQLQTGDTLKTSDEPSISDIIQQSGGMVKQAQGILSQMTDLMSDIKNGKGTAGQLIEDPTLYNHAEHTIAELDTLVANLNSGEGSAGKLLHDNQLYDHLNQVSANLDDISAKLNHGHGSAGKLLTDDTLYDNLTKLTGHANSLLADADAGKGALGLLTKDPAFAKKLDDTLTNLDTLLAGVNSGKGTLGQLATSQDMSNNINTLLKSSNDLIGAIRADPKKYLTIHMKIF